MSCLNDRLRCVRSTDEAKSKATAVGQVNRGIRSHQYFFPPPLLPLPTSLGLQVLAIRGCRTPPILPIKLDTTKPPGVPGGNAKAMGLFLFGVSDSRRSCNRLVCAVSIRVRWFGVSGQLYLLLPHLRELYQQQSPRATGK